MHNRHKDSCSDGMCVGEWVGGWGVGCGGCHCVGGGRVEGERGGGLRDSVTFQQSTC